MSQNLANKFVPKFVSNNLPWYERDGLMTWHEKGKCSDFLEDTDKHFQNKKIINFDIISQKGDISKENLKQYQTINHKEILSYPSDLEDKFSRLCLEQRGRICMFLKKV